jgi:hypothetical protein
MRAAKPTAPIIRPVARLTPLAVAVAAAASLVASESVAAAVAPAAGFAFVDRMVGPDGDDVAPPSETVTASFMPDAQWPAAPQMK